MITIFFLFNLIDSFHIKILQEIVVQFHFIFALSYQLFFAWFLFILLLELYPHINYFIKSVLGRVVLKLACECFDKELAVNYYYQY